MIDHRILQRTLFRMQLDPAFAAAVRDDSEAAAPELGEQERRMLAGVPLAALLADPRGRRRAQVLGNVASEYALSLTEASRAGAGAILADFPGSEQFHRAVRRDESLPLAFGDHLQASAAVDGRWLLAALARLEAGMARSRRGLRPERRLRPGEFAMSRRASLIVLPEGTFQHAQTLRAALDAGRLPPEPPPALRALGAAALQPPPEAEGHSGPYETVLLVASATPRGDRLREVAAERLEPDVARLLHAAEQPIGGERLARLCSESGWASADVGEFVNELVADGVLSRG